MGREFPPPGASYGRKEIASLRKWRKPSSLVTGGHFSPMPMNSFLGRTDKCLLGLPTHGSEACRLNEKLGGPRGSWPSVG